MAIRISGMMSGLDTDSIIKELTSAYSVKKDNYVKAQKLNQIKQEQWKEVNKNVYSFYTGSLSKARLQGNYKSNNLESSNNSIATNVSGKGEADVYIQQLATKTYVTGTRVKDEDWPIGQNTSFDVKIGGRRQTIEITGDMKMKDVAKKMSDIGLEANFDEKTGRLFVASKGTGENSYFEIEGDNELLSKMGLSSATISKGQDAVAIINGAEFKQNNNTFDINNIKFDAIGTGNTHIGKSNDNNIYDIIKQFVDDYNNVIKDLDTRYNAASIKSYQPLTEEEEDALTDKEVEKWNNKINEGCLRKDSTLSSISSLMRTAASGAIEINGKKYSLASMGITTNGYFVKDANERNCLTIDEDKLKSFINENEDVAINIASKVATNIYDKLGQKMKSTSLNSAYSIYNDKQMEKEYSSYNSIISKWEDKITAIEDKYYKQFATMEKMLAQMQGNSTSLTNLFG